jgi:AraC family transcriptional regulator
MSPQDCLHASDYAARSTLAPHAHDEPSLSVVVHGGFAERIGGSERAYARGHVAFFPAGVTHAQTFGPQGAREIIFRPRREWMDYLTDCKVALDTSPHVNAPDFRNLGDRLLREIRLDDAVSTLAREGLMLEIVAAFGRGCGPRAADAPPPAWLRAARDFIHENALEPLSLDEVARAAGRHQIHLAREFRRHFGASIGAYQRTLRTEHAARLLLRSDLTISEIALECGFSSHAHLCREFRAHFGTTPSCYRGAFRN